MRAEVKHFLVRFNDSGNDVLLERKLTILVTDSTTLIIPVSY